MSAYMPPQWIACLKEWAVDNPKTYREVMEVMKDNIELSWSISDKALARDDYEEHLTFKEMALDEEEELEIMKDIIESLVSKY